jgi:hypothetical protein
VFPKSSLDADIRKGSLHLPPDKPLPGTGRSMPHILGDEAFYLKDMCSDPTQGSVRDSEQLLESNYQALQNSQSI